MRILANKCSVALVVVGFCHFTFSVLGADVVLNEVMAVNHTTIVNGGKTPDWIELYNTTSTPKDLGGMSLSDDAALPRKFVFPANTIVDGNSRIVIWCDDDLGAPGIHTGFALSATGQRLTLYSADAVPKQIDAVEFGLQLQDLSIGRVPDGSGSWQLCKPTPWMPNSAQQLGSRSRLRINEWMASSSAGDDWFELYNGDSLPVALGGLTFTDTPTEPAKSIVPALSFIAPLGFQLFWADQKPYLGADHVDFKLGAGGESIGIYSGSTALDLVNFGQQQTDVSMGRLPDGSATFVFFTKTVSPGESNYMLLTNIAINEVLAHTDLPMEDAVELLNLTSNQIDISGWYLSNSENEPMKYRIPNGTVVPANGYLVFYEYQFNSQSSPTAFTFNSAHGDNVVLSEAKNGALTGYRISQKFPASANGVSFGRVITSVGTDFAPLISPTFGVDNPQTVAEFRTGKGAANTGPQVGPVVINEIMYHPPDIVTATSTNDNVLDEYIELRNITSSEVLLFDPVYPANTWRLDNAVTFAFAMGTKIPPGGLILVVGFNPQSNASQLAAFRAKYNITDDIRIYGPWSGKLSNDGETVELLRPDVPQAPPHPDAGYVPYVPVDRIKYSDTAPWPVQADGLGPSLQRLNGNCYGNDPANWFANMPSPGRDNAPVQIASVEVSDSRFVMSFTTFPKLAYSVEASDSLIAPSWTRVAEYPATPTPQQRQFIDTIAPNQNHRFYRIVATAAP